MTRERGSGPIGADPPRGEGAHAQKLALRASESPTFESPTWESPTSESSAGLTGALTLDAAGHGSYAAGNIQAWGRGTAIERILGVEVQRETTAVLFTNTGAVDVSIDWNAGTFSIDDEFAMSPGEDPSTDPSVTVAVHASGELFNQPPIARISIPAFVECDSPGGADVLLDGSSTVDHDGNVVAHVWRNGLLLNDAVLAVAPQILVRQSVDTIELYSLRVLDGNFQHSLATLNVTVQDTTAPTIGEVTIEPTCLWSPNHKWVRYAVGTNVLADIADTCDANAQLRIVSVTSSDAGDGTGAGATDPDVIVGDTGFCIRAERSADGDRTYTVVVAAGDAQGNETTSEVEIRVPRDREPGCELVQGITDRQAEALCEFPPLATASSMPEPPHLIRVVTPESGASSSTSEAVASSSGSAQSAAGCSASTGAREDCALPLSALLALGIWWRRRR